VCEKNKQTEMATAALTRKGPIPDKKCEVHKYDLSAMLIKCSSPTSTHIATKKKQYRNYG
jgi:hypothetical protein